MISPPDAEAAERRALRRQRIAECQSDMAYFQARLALIGVPKRAHQIAQRQAFEELHRSLAQTLAALRQDAAADD